MRKKNFKIYAEVIDYNPNIGTTYKVGEKFLLGTMTSEGVAQIVRNALRDTYKPEYYLLTIE
jgi:hypothetical protein